MASRGVSIALTSYALERTSTGWVINADVTESAFFAGKAGVGWGADALLDSSGSFTTQ